MPPRLPPSLAAALAIAGMCAAFLTAVAIYAGDHPSPMIDRAFNVFMTTFNLAAGAVVALIGGQNRMPPEDQ